MQWRKDKNSREMIALFALCRGKIDRTLTKRNQIIVYCISLGLAILSILDVVMELFPLPVSIAIDICAAFGLTLTVTLWVKTIRFLIRVVLVPFTQKNKIANTLIRDQRLRAVVTTLPGIGLSLIFAAFNGIISITSRCAWYASLSVYYILLCAMRVVSVSYAGQIYRRKRNTADNVWRELKVYRNCGMMLSAMSVALAGAVIMLVSGVGGKFYPGFFVYAVAAYTFYKLILSVKNMLQARKENSVLLITLRNIGFSDALVSLLSLQTALFAAFGSNSESFIPLMNSLTGTAVSLSVLLLGIYMVSDAGKRKTNLQIEKEK